MEWRDALDCRCLVASFCGCLRWWKHRRQQRYAAAGANPESTATGPRPVSSATPAIANASADGIAKRQSDECAKRIVLDAFLEFLGRDRLHRLGRDWLVGNKGTVRIAVDRRARGYTQLHDYVQRLRRFDSEDGNRQRHHDHATTTATPDRCGWWLPDANA